MRLDGIKTAKMVKDQHSLCNKIMTKGAVVVKVYLTLISKG